MSQGDTWGALRAMLTLAAYIVVIYTRCLGVLLRSVTLTGCLVSLHAALRRARSEYLTRGPRLGVSMLAVLGLEQAPVGMDPHRLFKEMGAAGWSMVTGVLGYTWYRISYGCRDWWRYNRWLRR